jgi:hypothetical protein
MTPFERPAASERRTSHPDHQRKDIMRFMVMHYETEAMEAGEPPTPETQAAIGQYIGELAMSGVLLAGEGVGPSSLGARLTVDGAGHVSVTDGPFAEAKELIGGFAILEVSSKEEAIEHAKRWAKMIGVTKIDIRRVVDAPAD